MTEMTFDVPSVNSGADSLSQKSGSAASDLTNGVTSNLAPPSASSPVGGLISMLAGQLQGGLATVGPSLSQDAVSNKPTTPERRSTASRPSAGRCKKKSWTASLNRRRS